MDRTLGRVKAEGHISFKGIRINKILELVNAWVGWRVEVHGKGKWWWKKKKSKQEHDTPFFVMDAVKLREQMVQ